MISSSRRLIHAVVLCAISALAAARVASADVIHLKDGGKVEGNVKRSDDGWVVRGPNGATTRIAADQVQSIELTASAASSTRLAAERLASLRRSVEPLDDPREIIVRYQRFIDQMKDPATLDDAKRDLAQWQERADRGMVKVGTRWIMPEDRAGLAQRSMILSDGARQLVKQGRIDEAAPLLSEAVADDPQNVSALYLLGLVRMQQDQVPAARKAFESLNQILPGHAPTLNNFAITQWRQRQFVAALISFDGAMQAAPINKDILDNVYAALSGLPPEFQNSTVTQRVARHFDEQDRQLAQQMAKAGWHRVDGVWMTDKELEDYLKAQQQTRQQLDALAGDFEKSKQRAADFQQRIDATEEQMHRIEAGSYVRDPSSGLFLRIPYPPVYFDMSRDDARLRQQLDAEVGKLNQMQQTAQALQAKLPGGGQQDFELRLIGLEGTPLRLPAAPPTTQP
jgi:tetratricopeptide (TPR) repeat protein